MDNLAWVKHAMPEQEIPVSMHGWMEGLNQSPPGLNIQEFLLHVKNFGNLHIRDRMRAAEVSDTLIFDYLLDGATSTMPCYRTPLVIPALLHTLSLSHTLTHTRAVSHTHSLFHITRNPRPAQFLPSLSYVVTLSHALSLS